MLRGHFPRGGGEAEPWGAFLVMVPGPWLAAEGHVGAELWAGGPGNPPGCSGTCLITRARAHIRREGGDSPPPGLLCFHSLQVPHLQTWVLHPRGFHSQVPFACFIHSLAHVGLMNTWHSTPKCPCAPSVPLTHLQVMFWLLHESQILSSTSPVIWGRFSSRIYSIGLLIFRNRSLWTTHLFAGKHHLVGFLFLCHLQWQFWNKISKRTNKCQ